VRRREDGGGPDAQGNPVVRAVRKREGDDHQAGAEQEDDEVDGESSRHVRLGT